MCGPRGGALGGSRPRQAGRGADAKIDQAFRRLVAEEERRRTRELPIDSLIALAALRELKRVSADELAERIQRDALTANGLEWEELPGEGAFYAPKLEWHLTDAIGRTWQVGTIQSDRVLPERLDAHYIGEDGEKHRPVMLHRAIFGSYERFIGILIEHFAGRLPAWLAPVQAVVATIVSDADGYAHDVEAQLKAAGIRVETDTRNEKINYKVREHSVGKVPVILAIGMKEVEERTVSVRRLGDTRTETMSLDQALAEFGFAALPPAGH